MLVKQVWNSRSGVVATIFLVRTVMVYSAESSIETTKHCGHVKSIDIQGWETRPGR